MLFMLGDRLDLSTRVDIPQILGEIDLVLWLLLDSTVRILSEIKFLWTVKPTNFVVLGQTIQIDCLVSEIYLFRRMKLFFLFHIDSYFWNLNPDHDG